MSETNLEFTLPDDLVREMHNTFSDASDNTLAKILRQSLQFGLLADKMAPSGDRLYIVQHGKRMRISSDLAPGQGKVDEDGIPLFSLEESDHPINPAEDLQEVWKNIGAQLHESPEEFQQQAKADIHDVSQQIAATLPNYLNTSQLQILASLHEGVRVVDSLRPIKQLKKIASLKNFLERMIVDTYGQIFPPFSSAILLAKATFESNFATWKTYIEAHEIMHTLSQNGLQQTLNEAATDLYAALISGINPKNRLGQNLAYAYDSWKLIDQIAGSQLAFQGYCEAPLKLITTDARRRPIAVQYIDSAFHDHMREQLGKTKDDASLWDTIMLNFERNEPKKGLELLKNRSTVPQL